MSYVIFKYKEIPPYNSKIHLVQTYNDLYA